jgi:hypothetical protein
MLIEDWLSARAVLRSMGDCSWRDLQHRAQFGIEAIVNIFKQDGGTEALQ